MYLSYLCFIAVNIGLNYVDLNMFMQLFFWAGNQGNYQISTHPCYQETLTDFDGDETFFFLNSKMSLSILPNLNIFFQKFQGLVLWLVGLIDVKGIDVAQPMWL